MPEHRAIKTCTHLQMYLVKLCLLSSQSLHRMSLTLINVESFLLVTITSPVRVVVIPCEDGKLRRGGGGGGDLDGFSVRYLGTVSSSENRKVQLITHTIPKNYSKAKCNSVSLLTWAPPSVSIYFGTKFLCLLWFAGTVLWGRCHTSSWFVLGSKVQIWNSLHELGLGFFQKPVNILSTVLCQCGSFLLPVTLCCLLWELVKYSCKW